VSNEIKFTDSKYNYNFELSELLKLSDKEFRLKFAGSPIKRIGRDRFLRNCCIAAGNSSNTNLVPVLVELVLYDQSPFVRGAAIWAVKELAQVEIIVNTRKFSKKIETNASVIREWD
jgi:epoxyqueuosine reductase